MVNSVTTNGPANTSSTATTGNVTVKATAGRYYGYTSGAVGTNATAINITDGNGGTLLDFIPINCPANTQHLFAGGIPFATNLFIAGVAGGPTITVYFS